MNDLEWRHINVHVGLEDGMPSESSVGSWELYNGVRRVGRAWPRIGTWHASVGDDGKAQSFPDRTAAFRFLLDQIGNPG